MSSVSTLDKTVGASNTDGALPLNITDYGEKVIINYPPPIDIAKGIPSDTSLKWTSEFGPLRWTVPGIDVEEEPTEIEATDNIWDKPSILAMLNQSIGTPISLTRDEALEISRQAFGSNPDLIPGKEFVSRVRPLIGRSILKKIKKSGG